MKIRDNNKISQTLSLSFLLLFLVIPVNANFTTPNLSGYDLELKLDPEYPTANQTVSAKVELYGLDINKFEILWFVNNSLKEKGVGQKEFFFQTGSWGKTTTLAVQVNTTNNGQIQKQIQIIPAEVDLIWEAETYTPPFYKGKTLNSSNAVINVVALPNFIDRSGQKIAPEKLIYKWKEDWKVKGNHSGYGKRTLSLEGPQTGRSKSITVEVKSTDGTLAAKKTISLRARSPEIIFYRQDPLLGTLYNTAIKNEYTLSSEELKVIASPFFISPQDEIKYQWTMNGQTMNFYGNEIILRKPNNQVGSTQIKLKLNNLDSILQFIDNDFLIKFGE